MKTLLLSLLVVALVCEAYGQSTKSEAYVLVKDKKIKELIADVESKTAIEILASGFEWTEGPLWLEKENKLIFSDIPNNSIFEWTQENGLKLYLKPSGYTGKDRRSGEPGSNGLLLNPAGDLILCQHGDRRVAIMQAPLDKPEAKYQTLAGEFKGKRLNSPNDAVYHKNGDLYFTDPPYGLERNVNDPAKELDFQGVYKLGIDGHLTLLTKELSRPNGIGFSPDFKKLYVANSDPENAIWMVYQVDKSGLLKKGKIFFNATELVKKYKGLPDGLKVHPKGWVFATGPGGVFVFSPNGDHLGTIITGEATANCAFNSDHSELFITADNYLLRIKLKK